MLKIIKRRYVNKRDRSILGEIQKEIIKKQTGSLLPIAKAVLSVFNLGKKRKYGKKKENNYSKKRRSKKSYSTKR